MPWITPKTNWENGVERGNFTWEDYERIRLNIECLGDLASRIFAPITLSPMRSVDERVEQLAQWTGHMPGEPISDRMRLSSWITEYDLNQISANINYLLDNTVRPLGAITIGQFWGNLKVPTAGSINAIERNCQLLYDAYYAHNLLSDLPIVLNGGITWGL